MGKPRKQKRCGNYYAPDPNKPDEDIVNDYLLRHNIRKEKFYKLLTNSEKTRRYESLKRKGITEFEKPPRPQNSFILYRRFKSRSTEFKKRRKKDRKVKLTSKEIGILWDDETVEVKKVFYAFQRMVKIKHREIYGDDYKYKKKKSQQKSRKTKNKRDSSISSDYSSTESSTDSISSNMSMHTLGDSTSSNLNLPNQNMLNDTTSGDYSRSYNHNLTNNTLGDSTSPNLNLPNQTMMNDATSGDYSRSRNHNLTNNTLGDSTSPNLRLQNPNLMNADVFRDSIPPNLISQNQNIMNDATSGDYNDLNYILEDSTSSNNATSGDYYDLTYIFEDTTSSNNATSGDYHDLTYILEDTTSSNNTTSGNYHDLTYILKDSTSSNNTTSGDYYDLTYILEDSTSSNLSSQNHNLPNYAFENSTLPDLPNLMGYDYVLEDYTSMDYQDNLNNYVDFTSSNNGFCTQQSSNFDSTDPFEPDYMIDNSYLYVDFIRRQLLESNPTESL